jgi:ABC-type branched-subunit amino acid transport system substrate-binding protein
MMIRRSLIVPCMLACAVVCCLAACAHASEPAVGVVLPLSGRWGPVGQRILKGVMCASGVFGPEASSLRFVVKDCGDDEALLASQVEALASDGSIVAVIGPVGERASEAACRIASAKGLPLISFTQAEVPRVQGTTCFRNFLTVEMQAKALLRAASSLGARRFAVLSPDDQFGRAFTEAFTRQGPEFGVSVVRSRIYPARNPDFSRELNALFSGAGAKADRFDALLVPDGAANAGMIASYLGLMKRRNVRLFGPALWDSPDLVRAGGANVEGAVFLSGFFPSGVASAARDFADRFRAYGGQPGIWEASGYDTARIISSLVDQGWDSRRKLAERLPAVRRYEGAGGVTSLFPDGSLEKQPCVLTIRGGEVVEIFP